MLEAKTSLVGINAKIGDLVNIDQVIASGSWSNNTVVINCSYFGNNSSDGDFIDKHQGKLFHGGAWDQTCSIPSNWAFGVAGYAGTATAGKFEFGGEDLPNDLFYGHTQEGSGGLPNSAPGISLTWNCLAKVRLPGLVGNDQGDQNSPYEHILLSAVFGHDNGAGLAAATFDADVRKGGTHGDVFWCDGGGSYAQAIASPAGTLIKTAAAARHTWRGTLINECIKTYLGFKAKRPR